MSFAYRINVFDADGTPRASYDSTDPVASLESFDVDANGSCGEATFRVLPKGVDIRPRDNVELEVATDGVTFEPVYLGTVVQAPNPRSDEIEVVRCVGLKQRLYELSIRNPSLINGVSQPPFFVGDVAKMVAEIFDSSLPLFTPLPGMVTFNAADAPDTNFRLGVRYPNRESVGDALDALAATVGSFIVPATVTYTYDGVTFAAGDIVPAVTWGVNAKGELFFRRPLETPVVIEEGDEDVDVTWNEVTAEEFVNAVNLVYVAAYDLRFVTEARAFTFTTLPDPVVTRTQPQMLPIVRSFVSPSIGPNPDDVRAEVTVQAVDPLALMTQTPTLDFVNTGWTNPDDAVDDDPSTFASITGGTDADTLLFGGNPSFGPPFPQQIPEGILLVRYSSTEELKFEVNLTTFIGFDVVRYSGALPPTLDINTSSLVALAIGTPQNANQYFTGANSQANVTFFGNANARIRTVQAFQPDVDAGGTRSQEYAEGFMTRSRSVVSTIRVRGIGPVTGLASVEPIGESPVEARVERITFSITANRGVETTYRVDQAFNAEEEAERVLLTRLALRSGTFQRERIES